jgi:hypothetical protein
MNKIRQFCAVNTSLAHPAGIEREIERERRRILHVGKEERLKRNRFCFWLLPLKRPRRRDWNGKEMAQTLEEKEAGGRDDGF